MRKNYENEGGDGYSSRSEDDEVAGAGRLRSSSPPSFCFHQGHEGIYLVI
jgi:hypothetical protein